MENKENYPYYPNGYPVTQTNFDNPMYRATQTTTITTQPYMSSDVQRIGTLSHNTYLQSQEKNNEYCGCCNNNTSTQRQQRNDRCRECCVECCNCMDSSSDPCFWYWLGYKDASGKNCCDDYCKCAHCCECPKDCCDCDCDDDN